MFITQCRSKTSATLSSSAKHYCWLQVSDSCGFFYRGPAWALLCFLGTVGKLQAIPDWKEMATLTKMNVPFLGQKTNQPTKQEALACPSAVLNHSTELTGDSAENYCLIHSCWPQVTSRNSYLCSRYNPKDILESHHLWWWAAAPWSFLAPVNSHPAFSPTLCSGKQWILQAFNCH